MMELKTSLDASQVGQQILSYILAPVVKYHRITCVALTIFLVIRTRST